MSRQNSLLLQPVRVRLFKEEVALTLVLATACFGQLLRLVLPTGLIFLHEYVMVAMMGWWCFELWQQRLQLSHSLRFKSRPHWLPLIIWGGAMILAALLRTTNLPMTSAYIARVSFYLAWAAGVRRLIRQGRVRPQLALFSLFAGGLLLAFWGILQFLIFPDTRGLFWLGWDDHYYRLISTMLDPGFTGILLLLSWLTGWQLLEKSRLRSNEITAGWVLASSLLLAAVALTYSRATYLSLLVSGALLTKWWLRSGWWKVVAVTGVIAAVVFSIAPRPGGEGVKLTRTSTITARTHELSEQLGLIHGWVWVTGRGFFVFTTKDAATEYEVPDRARIPNSWPVLIMQSTGLIGILVTGVAGSMLMKSARVAWWWKVQLTAVLVHGLFQASIVYPFVMLWLGVSFAANTLSRSPAKVTQKKTL